MMGENPFNYSYTGSDFLEVSKVFPTIILQTGFILVHIGCIPTNDVSLIVIQHILSMAFSSVSFLSFGFPVAFGRDKMGIMGTNTWILNEYADMKKALTGWSAVSVSSSIIETALAGRVHIISNIIITILLSGFFQPVIMHWTWTQNGWTQNSTYFTQPLSFIDYGGSAVIHAFSGGFFLGAILILGKRFITMTDVDDNSVPVNSHSTSTVGYAFILIGLIGNTYSYAINSTLYLLNCLISINTGILIAAIFNFIEKNEHDYWFAIWMLQGATASMVTLSAGINMYCIEMTILTSFLGTTCYYITSKIIQFFGLNDNCNIIAIHLIGGSIGCLLLPCPLPKIITRNSNIFAQFGWQFVCTTVIFLAGFTLSVIILLNLQFLKILRNNTEQQFYDEALKSSNTFLRTCLCCTLNQPPRLLQPGLHTITKVNKTNKPIFKNNFKYRPNYMVDPLQTEERQADLDKNNQEHYFQNIQSHNKKVTILPPKDTND